MISDSQVYTIMIIALIGAVLAIRLGATLFA